MRTLHCAKQSQKRWCEVRFLCGSSVKAPLGLTSGEHELPCSAARGRNAGQQLKSEPFNGIKKFAAKVIHNTDAPFTTKLQTICYEMYISCSGLKHRLWAKTPAVGKRFLPVLLPFQIAINRFMVHHVLNLCCNTAILLFSGILTRCTVKQLLSFSPLIDLII